MLMKFLER